MKKVYELCCVALLAAFAFYGLFALSAQREISDQVIRLHVVGSSDSEEDQRVKLLVRDAILENFGASLSACRSRAEAEEYIYDREKQIEALSREVLLQEGRTGEAYVSLSEETFPTRYYDTFSLPAGEYMSLRVVLGDGEGHNWWCVVYPPLCVEGALTESRSLSEEELHLITSGEGEVKVRFFCLEMLSRLQALFASKKV